MDYSTLDLERIAGQLADISDLEEIMGRDCTCDSSNHTIDLPCTVAAYWRVVPSCSQPVRNWCSARHALYLSHLESRWVCDKCGHPQEECWNVYPI